MASWLCRQDLSGKLVLPFYSHCGGVPCDLRRDILALCPKADVREALLSAILEGGDAVVDMLTLGIGKGIAALVGQPAKAAATSAGRKALSVLGKYGINVASEGAQEWVQEGVSSANAAREGTGALNLIGETAGQIGRAVSGQDPEALARMNQAGIEGMKVAAIMGGASLGGNALLNRVVSRSASGGNIQQENVQTDNRLVLPGNEQNNTAPESGAVIRDYQRAEHHGEILDTVQANLDRVSSLRPVAELTGQEFQKTAGDNRSLRQRIVEFFNSIGNKVTRQDLGEIELNTSGVRDSLAHGYGRLKTATFASLPQVIENGTLIAHNGPYEGHDYDSYIISAPVNVGGETVYVGALVIKDRTQRYKLHEVLTASESGTPLFQSEATSQGADGPLRNDMPLGEPEGSPTNNSILPGGQGVNVRDAADSAPEADSRLYPPGVTTPLPCQRPRR